VKYFCLGEGLIRREWEKKGQRAVEEGTQGNLAWAIGKRRYIENDKWKEIMVVGLLKLIQKQKEEVTEGVGENGPTKSLFVEEMPTSGEGGGDYLPEERRETQISDHRGGGGLADGAREAI